MNLLLGDCLETLMGLPDNCVDSVVTDPPYGLGKEPKAEEILAAWLESGRANVTGGGFMGKEWDSFVPSPDIWREVLRVLKPGGYVLSFFGTRTYDWGVMSMRLAGFKVKDQIGWLTGSGFPKSLNINKEATKKGYACACEEIPEHNLRPLRDADLSEAVDLGDESREVLQSGLSKQGAPEFRKKGRSALRGKESLLAGRKLHRAGERLSDDPNGGPSKGKSERLRSRARRRSREDAWSSVETGRSGSSSQSQSGGQSARESQSVCESSRALDGTPFPRCSRCARPILPQGLGSALKPAIEPIVLAQKPIEKGLTISANVLKYGTGAINVDASRIEGAIPQVPQPKIPGGDMLARDKRYEGRNGSLSRAEGRWPANILLDDEAAAVLDEMSGISTRKDLRLECKAEGFGAGLFEGGKISKAARVQDHGGGASRFFKVISQEEIDTFATCSNSANIAATTSKPLSQFVASVQNLAAILEVLEAESSSGTIYLSTLGMLSALRQLDASNIETILSTVEKFLHECKPIEKSRSNHASCAAIQKLIDITTTIRSLLRSDSFAEAVTSSNTQVSLAHGAKGFVGRFAYVAKASRRERSAGLDSPSTHPTVKPVKLMEYLVRMVTPQGGTVLDPFMGSGSTGVAATNLGFEFIGCELSPEYMEIAKRRIEHAHGKESAA